MKHFSLKHQEDLHKLFKAFLGRNNYHPEDINTYLIEEKMKVMQYSLVKEENILTYEDKKIAAQIAFNLIKKIAYYFLSIQKSFNPLVILVSADSLFLCEIPRGKLKRKFSIIGKYAKIHKCLYGVFIELLEENKRYPFIISTLSMAYDESLIFKKGKDYAFKAYIPDYDSNENLKLKRIFTDSFLKFPEKAFMLQDMRKPMGRILPLGKINLN